MRLRCETPSPELVSIQRKLRLISRETERAILTHDYEVAKGLALREAATQAEIQRLS